MRNTVALHLYCLPGIRFKLERMAQAHHRSLSAEVQVLIEKAFQEYTKDIAAPPTKSDLKG